MYKFAILTAFILILSSCNKSLQSLNPQITDHLHDIEVVDKNTAFAYTYGTGQFLSTKNSGETWQTVHKFDSIYFEQMQFFDAQNGWLAGNNKQLLKTKNGGKTWEDKSLTEWKELDAIYGMVFTNPQKGFISVLTQSKDGLVTKIYNTTDGGDNWLLHSTLSQMILNLEYHNNTLWASGNNVILKLTEGATEWQTIFKDENKKAGQIRDLEFISEHKIVAATFTGQIVNCNKKNCKQKKITTNRLRSLSIFANGKGVVDGDNVKNDNNVYTTSNYGKTWLKSTTALPDIHRTFKKDKHIWMAGKKGFITKIKKFKSLKAPH